MKMPLPFLEKKESTEHFLALILQNEKTTSIIFEKIGSAIKYISHSEEVFKNTVEDSETEEFLNVLDKAITSAEASLPENVETHKTLFGLKENWIEEGKIKKEYLDKLKKASDELSLEPIGFMVFSESIINLIQKEEGAPVTAVLADIGKKYITVSLIKAGKTIETRTSEIHQSASYTVDTLLKHFQTPEVMPSRVIILDSEEDELTQEFIGHKWSKSLPFLHLPQIMSLPEDASIKAMLLGAATQMGTELLYESQRALTEDRPEKIVPEEVEEVTKIENNIDEEKEETTDEEKPSLDYVAEDKSMEYFGFVEGSDIAKSETPTITPQKKTPDEVVEETIDEIPEQVKLNEEKKDKLPLLIALVTTKIKNFLGVLPSILSKVRIDKGLLQAVTKGNKMLLIIPGALIILLIAVLYLYLFTTKATITLSVSAKEEEKSAPITFSSDSSTDIEGSIISAEFVSVSEDGSVTTKATGGKEIGEKAKGTVTVFNNDSKSVNLPAGTAISSSNNLKFTFDTAVNVASASGDIFSGTKPGTANVNITASEIGQEYNLPSGTKFTLSSNSNVAAKNDNAFSGGSKKKITVVSEDDLNKLLADLPKKLEEKARSDVKGKAQEGKTILSTFVEKTVSGEKYSKKEGDEASEVTLTGTVDFEAISYNDKDALDFALTLFTSSDTELNKDNLQIEAKNIKVEKNQDVTANLSIKARLLPKIDKDSLLKEIAGTSLQKAKNRLGNVTQVTNVDINISPNIPFLPKNLPGNPKNIILNISSN